MGETQRIHPFKRSMDGVKIKKKKHGSVDKRGLSSTAFDQLPVASFTTFTGYDYKNKGVAIANRHPTRMRSKTSQKIPSQKSVVAFLPEGGRLKGTKKRRRREGLVKWNV